MLHKSINLPSTSTSSSSPPLRKLLCYRNKPYLYKLLIYFFLRILITLDLHIQHCPSFLAALFNTLALASWGSEYSYGCSLSQSYLKQIQSRYYPSFPDMESCINLGMYSTQLAILTKFYKTNILSVCGSDKPAHNRIFS